MAIKKSSKPAAKKKTTPAKRSVPVKKSASKKTAVKKVTKKKATPKKAIPQKSAPKKAVAKKTPTKKSTPKKAAGKKPAAKIAPKKTVNTKKPLISKSSKPKTKPVKASLPAPAELSEELAEQTVHNEQVVNQDTDQGHGLNPVERAEDPIRSFDKHEFQKATAKGDPRSKLHLSAAGKKPIRPSGKKPLWNK